MKKIIYLLVLLSAFFCLSAQDKKNGNVQIIMWDDQGRVLCYLETSKRDVCLEEDVGISMYYNLNITMQTLYCRKTAEEKFKNLGVTVTVKGDWIYPGGSSNYKGAKSIGAKNKTTLGGEGMEDIPPSIQPVIVELKPDGTIDVDLKDTNNISFCQ